MRVVFALLFLVLWPSYSFAYSAFASCDDGHHRCGYNAHDIPTPDQAAQEAVSLCEARNGVHCHLDRVYSNTCFVGANRVDAPGFGFATNLDPVRARQAALNACARNGVFCRVVFQYCDYTPVGAAPIAPMPPPVIITPPPPTTPEANFCRDNPDMCRLDRR